MQWSPNQCSKYFEVKPQDITQKIGEKKSWASSATVRNFPALRHPRRKTFIFFRYPLLCTPAKITLIRIHPGLTKSSHTVETARHSYQTDLWSLPVTLDWSSDQCVACFPPVSSRPSPHRPAFVARLRNNKFPFHNFLGKSKQADWRSCHITRACPPASPSAQWLRLKGGADSTADEPRLLQRTTNAEFFFSWNICSKFFCRESQLPVHRDIPAGTRLDICEKLWKPRSREIVKNSFSVYCNVALSACCPPFARLFIVSLAQANGPGCRLTPCLWLCPLYVIS